MGVADREVSGNLRILISTPNYSSAGGIQTLVENLERGLEERDQVVEIVHVERGNRYSLTDYLPRIRWCNSAEDVLRGMWAYRQVVYRNVSEAIARFDPDVVHAMHVQHFPALVAAREAGVPTVVSTYALELHDNEASRAAFARADRVHAISEFTRSLVMDLTEANPAGSASIEERTYIIPPSIDVDAYRPARPHEEGLPADDAPVVTLSRLAGDRKNVETVIRAWKRLPDSIKGERELVVGGDGPNRERLERLAKSSEDVRFLGYVEQTEKERLLSDAAVFVLVPKRIGYDAEGFGIVYVEAQAAGSPVIGSKTGGVPEAVGDGGILVADESNPDDVADAIERLLTDTDLRRSCLENARRRITRFDTGAVASKHLERYRALTADESY